MTDSSDIGLLFGGFSKLNRKQRLARLVKMGALTSEDVTFLEHAVQKKITHLAEDFIENVVGCFPMPLGVAANFCIDGRDRVIPMAVEETSIIAAASKTARWVSKQGAITTETRGCAVIGQIQLAKVNHFSAFAAIITAHKAELISDANEQVAHGLVARGGGVLDIKVRKISRDDGIDMAVLHVLINTCDAMGANIINQVCEYLKAPVEALTGETVTMCIISNLSDDKITRATVTLDNIDPALAEAIEEASLFAYYDPYRAATNNKGVLNGMDAVLLATGNDWRAVEAGVHAYAARDGQYRSITRWQREGHRLVGVLDAPIAVGTVGGVTRLHPSAQLCLRMLNVDHAEELARIVAAVGLVQNLGAIRALTTEGIIQGHMKLHISNLILAAGAANSEVPRLRQQLENMLKTCKKVTLGDAEAQLHKIRAVAAS